MKRHLLDTNVLSELRKRSRCHQSVANWQAGVPLEACWVSTISMFEIRKGYLKIRRKDPDFSMILEEWYAQLKQQFRGRILPVDFRTAETAATYSAQRTLGLPDTMIAATAKIGAFTLSTRNTRDFVDTGVMLVNPWNE